MRQGTPADEAINQAFGVPLTEVAKDFEDGRWRRDAVFKVPPRKDSPRLPPAQPMDPTQIKEALQVIADRVAKQPPNQ
jgi:hypothetical protein